MHRATGLWRTAVRPRVDVGAGLLRARAAARIDHRPPAARRGAGHDAGRAEGPPVPHRGDQRGRRQRLRGSQPLGPPGLARGPPRLRHHHHRRHRRRPARVPRPVVRGHRGRHPDGAEPARPPAPPGGLPRVLRPGDQHPGRLRERRHRPPERHADRAPDDPGQRAVQLRRDLVLPGRSRQLAHADRRRLGRHRPVHGRHPARVRGRRGAQRRDHRARPGRRLRRVRRDLARGHRSQGQAGPGAHPALRGRLGHQGDRAACRAERPDHDRGDHVHLRAGDQVLQLQRRQGPGGTSHLAGLHAPGRRILVGLHVPAPPPVGPHRGPARRLARSSSPRSAARRPRSASNSRTSSTTFARRSTRRSRAEEGSQRCSSCPSTRPSRRS